MGALLSSRQHDGVEEVDVVSNHAYKYPPRQGNYFGSHFIMGGERFDTPQPESYLFGENSDLNFLGSKPTPFPYPPPQPNEPTKTLKSLVNIRKESLRFVRCSFEGKLDKGEEHEANLVNNCSFNIEFTFDCDVRCSITIYYFCTEEFGPNGVTYSSKDSTLTSETFHFKKGANQQFCQINHVFNPSKYGEEELLYDVDRELIPIAIHCVAEEGPDDFRQSHTTVATVEKITDGTYLLKALKQKLFVDGLCYLLQEIYGIENKNNDKADGDDETEDNGSECVICMCDVRDTLILPCRHLCLCNSCADSLRYQANNCPICRAPFRALLQIRALQKCANPSLASISHPDVNCDNIPPGYEAVSLIEALNGPCLPRQPPAAMPDLVETPDNEHAIQAAQILNRTSPTKDFGVAVAVLMSVREEDSNKETKCPLLPEKRIPKDSVKLINEKCEKEQEQDEDSEAEKLSPLLQNRDKEGNLALNMSDITHSIDDLEENLHGVQDKRGEESDYYTPDEPAAPSSNCALYEGGNSLESTPQRLPGTPLSHASVRSSGESYTSGSSTRHLLAVVNSAGSPSDRSVHI